MLYQVWALIRTIDECSQPDSSIPIESVRDQTDKLIISVIDALEGDQEDDIVRYLLRLRSSLDDQQSGQALDPNVEAARAEVINIVNNFFYEKLTGLPEIRLYIDSFKP
jgi:acetolactate synthase small subunit